MGAHRAGTSKNPATKPKTAGTKKYLTATTLGLMTAATIVTSLRGLPSMAKEELTSAFS